MLENTKREEKKCLNIFAKIMFMKKLNTDENHINYVGNFFRNFHSTKLK